ncbi:LuxR C-terminal-related transcriptional regulator [Enterobacter cancerogenus]|uniref:helix-turn-helix transcriptional regulator n=1 Tax=Enterobacter cancerogenus TaxID=69218 RepID=UPI0030768625
MVTLTLDKQLDFISMGIIHFNKLVDEELKTAIRIQRYVNCVQLIDLNRYKSISELLRKLYKAKENEHATSLLLVQYDDQVIPGFTSWAIPLTASMYTWKRKLMLLYKEPPNIDNIIKECLALMNYTPLTKKQACVVRYLSLGMSIEEISQVMFLSIKTVYGYLNQAGSIYGFPTNKKFLRYLLNENCGSYVA